MSMSFKYCLENEESVLQRTNKHLLARKQPTCAQAQMMQTCSRVHHVQTTSPRGARVCTNMRRTGQVGIKPLILEECANQRNAATNSDYTPQNGTPHPGTVGNSIPEPSGRTLVNGRVPPPIFLGQHPA